MSRTGTSAPCAFTPSAIIVMQKGQATAISSACVASASPARSTLMRVPTVSSIHMRPPPAPQQSPLSLLRGISTRTTGSARLSVSRGAS